MLTFYTVDNYVWFIFTVPIWYCRNLPHWNFVSYQCAAARGGQFFYDIVYPIVEIHCRRRRQKFNDSTISVILTLKIYCRRRRQKKIRIWSKPCARILSLSASLVPPGGGLPDFSGWDLYSGFLSGWSPMQKAAFGGRNFVSSCGFDAVILQQNTIRMS